MSLERSIRAGASSFPLRIGRSAIHGRGVFSLSTIPSRRRVIEYTGERISAAQALARWQRILKRRGSKETYLFRLTRHRSIDGSIGGSGAQLINHSCDPNLRSRRIRNRIFYISRRTIRPGEELTVDYRFPPDAMKIKCRCRSPKCRGTINRR